MRTLSIGMLCYAGLLSAQPQTELRIVSEVNLVVVDVAVRDRQGKPLANLSKEQFRIFDNGRPKPLAAFAREDSPVSIGLIVDCSGSMMPKTGHLLTAVSALLSGSNPLDETFLVTFNDSVVTGATRPPEEIRRTLYATPIQGRTALYDGIHQGLAQVAKGKWERKTLVVISDGADNASLRSRREVLHEAMLQHATIYTIGISDIREHGRDPGLLRELASLSGGAAYIDIPVTELVETCRQIAREIRARYMVAFLASDATRQEKRRIRIQVDVPGGARVSARRAYLAMPPASRTRP